MRLLATPDESRQLLDDLPADARWKVICAIRIIGPRAMQACRTVYHVAADYRFWARDPREIYESNVQGTRNLLDAAGRAGVERFVYTSTVATVAVPSKAACCPTRARSPPWTR